jgi:hypothetical protein
VTTLSLRKKKATNNKKTTKSTMLAMRSASRAVVRRAPMMAARAFSETLNYPVVPKEDFGEYQEYSVIHTNRSLNLMSNPFQQVMRDLNLLLKTTYNADKVAIIPG